MSTAMLNLTDSSGRALQLPLANATSEDRIAQHKLSNARDGKIVKEFPYFTDIENYDRDSWQLGDQFGGE